MADLIITGIERAVQGAWWLRNQVKTHASNNEDCAALDIEFSRVQACAAALTCRVKASGISATAAGDFGKELTLLEKRLQKKYKDKGLLARFFHAKTVQEDLAALSDMLFRRHIECLVCTMTDVALDTRQAVAAASAHAEVGRRIAAATHSRVVELATKLSYMAVQISVLPSMVDEFAAVRKLLQKDGVHVIDCSARGVSAGGDDGSELLTVVFAVVGGTAQGVPDMIGSAVGFVAQQTPQIGGIAQGVHHTVFSAVGLLIQQSADIVCVMQQIPGTVVSTVGGFFEQIAHFPVPNFHEVASFFSLGLFRPP